MKCLNCQADIKGKEHIVTGEKSLYCIPCFKILFGK